MTEDHGDFADYCCQVCCLALPACCCGQVHDLRAEEAADQIHALFVTEGVAHIEDLSAVGQILYTRYMRRIK